LWIDSDWLPAREGWRGYLFILGTSAFGGGREKAGSAFAAGRLDEKLVASILAY
jgi:hypothetical protein